MPFDPTFIKNLDAALDCYDRERADELCTELIADLHGTDDIYPENHAKQILQKLRNKRFFDLMQNVADAFMQAGQTAPRIRRQYAQALLDQGNLSAGIYVLKNLMAENELPQSEYAEAKGLLGRAYKQFYINANARSVRRNQEHLKNAVACYHEVYNANREAYWHGVNAVALLMRARQDSFSISGFPDPAAMANDILKGIEDKKIEGTDTMWDCASAAEACLALRRYDQALEWLVRYASSQNADAFELNSTRRQLTEVWQLKETGQTDELKLLSVLDAAILRNHGGQVQVAASKNSLASLATLGKDADFEKVLGSDKFFDFQWFITAMSRASAVARVESNAGRKIGTGFLVQGKELHERLSESWHFLTNAHVMAKEAERGALSPDQATLNFELLNEKIPAGEIVWTSSRDKLDATLLRLGKVPHNIEPFPLAKNPPSPNTGRVYIVGYPAGGDLAFSLNDNKVLDYDLRYIHYRAPTMPGSSGSPVCNLDWELVGLHHSGSFLTPRLHGIGGTYAANEGILMEAIRADLSEALAV